MREHTVLKTQSTPAIFVGVFIFKSFIMNTLEINSIQRAILRREKTYKGFDLPTCQTAGKSAQISAHALQLATKFYNNNIK